MNHWDQTTDYRICFSGRSVCALVTASAWLRRINGIAIFLVIVFCTSALADQRIIRIGTGGGNGTYFPIGSLIAESMTRDAGGSLLEQESSDLIVLPQRSSGSVANVTDINDGLLESGLAQADVVHRAYHGLGPFAQTGPITSIRALATLYFESLHLVAHIDSGIEGVADLVGKRVSVDEIGSGTELDVRPIMDAFDISNDELKMVFLKPADSIDRLKQGQLDAFFIIAGYPVTGVAELIKAGTARLVPIAGPVIDRLLKDHPFLTTDQIPANTYSSSSAVKTLAVAAQWIISADVDEALVFAMTERLWSDDTKTRLTEGHSKGSDIRISSALKGIGIPLHAGAFRYYEGIGMAVSDLPY